MLTGTSKKREGAAFHIRPLQFSARVRRTDFPDVLNQPGSNAAEAEPIELFINHRLTTPVGANAVPPMADTSCIFKVVRFWTALYLNSAKPSSVITTLPLMASAASLARNATISAIDSGVCNFRRICWLAIISARPASL